MKFVFSKGATNDSKFIRTVVFINEQHFKYEFDNIDKYAYTLVIYDQGAPIATGRVYKYDDDNTYKLGRIAVLKEYRCNGIGKKIIDALENKAISVGAKRFLISAQLVAKPFYNKCGYVEFGEVYFDELVEHICMYKEI